MKVSRPLLVTTLLFSLSSLLLPTQAHANEVRVTSAMGSAERKTGPYYSAIVTHVSASSSTTFTSYNGVSELIFQDISEYGPFYTYPGHGEASISELSPLPVTLNTPGSSSKYGSYWPLAQAYAQMYSVYGSGFYIFDSKTIFIAYPN